MMHTAAILSVLVAGAAALVPRPILSSRSASASAASLSIDTTSGQLHGFVNATAAGTRQFLGVPYALPPVGALRFKPPQKVYGNAPIDTVAFQPSCKQQTSNATTIYTAYEPQFLINGPDSEDCLYLNVYAPLHPDPTEVAGLPVFVYIPGGGFTGGGANSLYKIPDQWVNATQAHIVVTINYRLNIFGFPAARGQYQNLGLQDIRQAVEWTRDNAAGFGGDPSRITLWGQSAGAMAVAYYAYGYYADPIVTGLIADSGAAGNLKAPNFDAFSTIAGQIGCGGLAAEDEIKCVQGVDAETLAQLVSTSSSVHFGPIADNITMYADLEARIQQGLVADVPLINGNNDNEGAGFSPSSGQTQATWEAGLNNIICPVSTEIALRTKYQLPTYRYYYAGNFSNISPQPWIGASHSAELPLIFGTHWEYRGNSTEFEWQVSATLQELWLSFARNASAHPTASSFTWPVYDATSNTTLYVAADNKVTQLVNGSLVDSLCPNSTCPTCAYFNSIGFD
ncbi:hypothetical protein Sste5346_008343 [Sporothrix stenoceras]|uniref:Carboxylic ester hydrolase n=1 Tax=Sporothrix stenoceras TaxID=5173 RepID=A0ABR3YPU8_9PEZI